MTFSSALCWSLSIVALSLFSITAHASSFIPFQPPSYPLAVRTPFLQAWLPSTAGGLLPASKAKWWDGTSIGWGTIARVDNVSYTIFGDLTNTLAVQTEAQFTSAHSTFLLQAGAVNITADFFSPVSPNNHVRHSLPLAYYTLTVVSADDEEHVVEIYNELGVNWAGPNGALNWTYTEDDAGGLVYYSISTASDIPFTANPRGKAMAEYGNVIFSTMLSSGLTNQSGDATTLRNSFTANGSLSGVQGLPAESDGTIAFAQTLGAVKEAQDVKIVVGNIRNKAINYLGTIRTPFYRSQYPDATSALQHFYDDYDDANAESLQLDQNITEEATAISSNYSDILRLSMRQIFGGMEITIPYDTLNTSDILSFLKEISTDGNVNTADVIFPMLPGLYVMAPEWIKFLIQPLLDYQMTGDWPNVWAVHDLGAIYPNATGHNNGKAEQLPVESSGDMILLAYAYTRATGDTTWPLQYSSLFSRWANYLMNNTLSSKLQAATTDVAGPLANQTELAIKACIALAAYGEMFNSSIHMTTGREYASQLYSSVGTNKQKTHFMLTHGPGSSSNSWTLGYNLFADALLNLSVFGAETFQMQSDWYPEVRQSAGVPLNTQVTWGKTDWNSWSAAISANSTRQMFIDDIHAYISNEQNSVPLSDRFWASGSKAGQAAQGVKDRPTVAGHWASLALERLTNSGQTMSWIQPKNPPLREKRSAAVSARLGGSIRWNCVCNILVGLSIWISVI